MFRRMLVSVIALALTFGVLPGLADAAPLAPGQQGGRVYLPLVAQPASVGPKPPTPAPPPAGNPIYWGVSMDGAPWDLNKLSAWERDVAGKGASILHWGQSWGDGAGYRAWVNKLADNTRGHGSIPMLSWHSSGGDPARWQLRKIINGEHDAYIREYATAARNWGHPFFLRFNHEMNGEWGFPWQEDENGNQRGEFVQAWRHVHDIFRAVGVTNASWVWCPSFDWNGSPRPGYASLYPGDAYVDWTCLDGYNFGTHSSEGWWSFDQVFNYSYNEVLEVAPSRPMMIGEFGSVEDGGSKANWLTDALKVQLPTRYPRMRAAVYFNWHMDGDDWRIETSQSSINAFKSGIGSSYYTSNTFGNLTTLPVP